MTKKANTKAEGKEQKNVSSEKKDAKKPVSKKNTSKKDSKAAKEAENALDKKTEVLSNEIESLKAEIEELKTKQTEADESSAEWHNKYLRLSAEFDNYRKRTLKEKAELTKQANGDLLKDILSVVDDFERGMDNIGKSEEIEPLKQGIELIYTKFVEFTRQNGVKEIDAKEKEFDIDFHEALTKIPAPTEELKGKVVDVIEKGYLLNDKVIRYSKVVVGE